MHANFYFDIQVRHGTELNVPDTFSLVARILHGSGKLFATSLPGLKDKTLGEILRVFGEDEETLDNIQDWISNGPADEYVSIRRVKPVPKTNVFEKFKVMNVKSFHSRNKRRVKRNHAPYTQEEIDVIKIKNLKINNTPFITMHSKKMGCSFKMFITREVCNKEENGTPNSYGFSGMIGEPSAAGSSKKHQDLVINAISLPVFDV